MNDIHELRINSNLFSELDSLSLKCEYRKDDSSFNTGDRIHYREVCNRKYTGKHLWAEITHILRHTDSEDIPDGFCILSLAVKNHGRVQP